MFKIVKMAVLVVCVVALFSPVQTSASDKHLEQVEVVARDDASRFAGARVSVRCHWLDGYWPWTGSWVCW